MTRLVEFPFENGGSIWVESDDGPVGPVTRGGSREAVEKASETLEAALGSVRGAASAVLSKMQDLPERPNSVEVEFGVKLSGKLGAILTTVSGEGHFTVRLSWQHQPSGGGDG